MLGRRRTRGGSVIGVRPIDTETSRRVAESKGKGDGARRFPLVTSTAEKATDHEGAGYAEEATTTDTLVLASHLAGNRAEVDVSLGHARAGTTRSTTRTADARKDYEDALAEHRGFQQSMPISGKVSFWSVRTVTAVLAGLALGSAAAIIAALQGATEDLEWLTYLIGSSVALATLVLGAVVGVHLRRRDLDDLKGGQYAAHSRRWWFLLVMGALGLLALARGVAGLRQASSEADAGRRAKQTQIEVFIPGQQAESPRVQAEAAKREGVVAWQMWFLFEFGVAVAAVFVEYHRADARVEWGERLEGRTSDAQETWAGSHQGLATALGEHEALVMTRADIDGAAVLTGQAHHQWADRLTRSYRYGNSSSRVEGGDPFEARGPADEAELVVRFRDIPGVDLPVMAPVSGATTASSPVQFLDNPDWSDREHIDVVILARGYLELSHEPERPARDTSVPWVPARDLAADPQVVALDAAFAKRRAEAAHANKGATNGAPGPDLDLSKLQQLSPSGDGNGGQS